MSRVLLSALALSLLVPAAAAAGGFATVQLSSTPAGLTAGETWSVDLTVLQHGRTPLDGIAPEIRVWSDGGPTGFRAVPTGQPGVYHANVAFPQAGSWRWEIWDGFSQTHTYAPAEIAPPEAAPRAGDGAPLWPWLVAAAGAVGLAGLGLLRVARQRGAFVRRAAPAR